MAGKGDQRITAGVLAALRRGPSDVLGLLAALRKVAGDVLGAREGHLHGLLHHLLKQAVIVADGRAASGLTLYAAAGKASGGPRMPGSRTPGPRTPGPVADTAEPPRPASAARARAAAKVARGARDPADRGRIVADALAHLGALEDAGEDERFGLVRSASHYVKRADRGRATVFFTAGGGDKWRRFFLHEGPWLLAALVVFLVVRAFVAEVFVIPSRSMVPTLEVGDRVVVFKPGGKTRPERWRIATFKKNDITYVKRVAGLGGESISLVGGDVFIDGLLDVKDDDVRRALRLPYATWPIGEAATPGGWTRFTEPASGGTRWVYQDPLESAGLSGTENGTPDQPLRDAYVSLRAERASGGEVRLALEFVDPDDRHLTEPQEAWVLTLSDAGGRLERRRFGEAPALVAAFEAPVPTGEVVLRLSHVDGVVRAGSGAHYLRADGTVTIGLVVRPAIEVDGAGSRPLALTLDKDVHYSPVGHHAVPPRDTDDKHVFQIPPGHVFFLGDNTYDSRDSRFRSMGTVPEAGLIGPVRIRIWPPARVGGVR